jgi:tetrahydromethanopterin S-methyltransferase subunit G
MATEKKGSRRVQLEGFVRGQVEEAHKRLGALEKEAHKRLGALEKEAERVMKSLAARGSQSRREVEALVARLNARELKGLVDPQLKQLGKRANEASTEVRRRLDGLQARVIEAVGVASQSQMKEINRELGRLAKKLDAVIGGKKDKTPRAAA